MTIAVDLGHKATKQTNNKKFPLCHCYGFIKSVDVRGTDVEMCLRKLHMVNSLLTSGNFCYLLITFANSLNPDQDRHNVGPDLDPNCLSLMVFLKEFFEKLFFVKSQQTTTTARKITQHAKS